MRKKFLTFGIFLLLAFGFSGAIAQAEEKTAGVSLIESTREAGFAIDCPEGSAYCHDGSKEYSASGVKFFILNILGYILRFAAIAAVLMLVVSGIRFVISRGNQEDIQAAQKNALWSLGGLVIIIVSLLLVENIGRTVDDSVVGGCTILVEDGVVDSRTNTATGDVPKLAEKFCQNKWNEGSEEYRKLILGFQQEYNRLECQEDANDKTKGTRKDIPEIGTRVCDGGSMSDISGYNSTGSLNPVAESEIRENQLLKATPSGEVLNGASGTGTSAGKSSGGLGFGLDLGDDEEDLENASGGLVDGGQSATTAPSNPTSYEPDEFPAGEGYNPEPNPTDYSGSGSSSGSSSSYSSYLSRTSLLYGNVLSSSGGGGNVNYSGITYIGGADEEIKEAIGRGASDEELQAIYDQLRQEGLSDEEVRELFEKNGLGNLINGSFPEGVLSASLDPTGKPFFGYGSAIATQPSRLSEEGPGEIFLVVSAITLGILGFRKVGFARK